MNKIFKILLSCAISTSLMFTTNSINAMSFENLNNATESVTTARSGYYSKGLVMLNISAGSSSNTCTITSGSVPANAVVTNVEVKGSGTGTTLYVRHEDTGFSSSKYVTSSTTSFSTEFDGLTADSSWTIWIEGSQWSTFRNGSIKVTYSY